MMVRGLFRSTVISLLLLRAASAGIVAEVRAAVAGRDLAGAEQRLAAYRKANGATPEALEALSWLARGALEAGQAGRAGEWAAEARKLAIAQLSARPLDAEPHLPVALGAAIEVQAQVMVKQGERAEAVAMLRRELQRYRGTSIRTRIQKNILLLSLEGKPAPPLEMRQWLGPKPPALASLRGRPVLLFFWAHWCGDCKAEAADIERLQHRFPRLAVIGPTQRYGYAAGGEEVPPEQELVYIDQVRRVFYGRLNDMPVPVSEENFRNYGASTTPTLVLIDGRGIVRLYHPGAISYERLARMLATES